MVGKQFVGDVNTPGVGNFAERRGSYVCKL